MDKTEAEKRASCGGGSWLRIALLAAAVIAAAAVAFYLACDAVQERDDETALRMLRSEDPQRRKLGAWLAVEQEAAPAMAFIARQLEQHRESVADIRESYVYALGQFGAAQHFEMVAALITDDPSGYVRQAAWLAAARIDRDRFRALADQAMDMLASSQPATNDAWDQIGLANACLRIGDVQAVPTLLYWAQNGNPDQQLVACGALHKGLAPLLEAAGRWPLGMELLEGQIWSPNLLDELARRCVELNLQAIADDTWPRLEAAARVQRDARRLTSARNWIVRILRAL